MDPQRVQLGSLETLPSPLEIFLVHIIIELYLVAAHILSPSFGFSESASEVLLATKKKHRTVHLPMREILIMYSHTYVRTTVIGPRILFHIASHDQQNSQR